MLGKIVMTKAGVFDGLDAASRHVFLREEGRIAAYLRLFDRPGEPGVVQIGRVLTVRRGVGLGGRLLRAGVRLAAERPGARELYLEAQVYAQGFYAREGVEPCTEEFLEDGIPHVGMRRKLSF